MAESFRIRASLARSSEFSIGELPKVGFIGVVVSKASGNKTSAGSGSCRHMQCHGLRVSQFRECLHVEAKVSVRVIALRGCELALWERALPVSKLTRASCPLSERL